jgi:hypothetical protein
MRYKSNANREGGFVLTRKRMDSPARTLAREQNPSIQGQRYFVAGSTPVLVIIQSRVPGLAFSRRIGLASSSGAGDWLNIRGIGDSPAMIPQDVFLRKTRRVVFIMLKF